MASRYWVGGTNTWNSTAGTKWATTSGGAGGASAPTSADDVFFDASSGSGTVTIAIGAACRNLDTTGFTGTIAGTAAFTLSGGLTWGAGTSVTYTGQFTFGATTGPNTVRTNGVHFVGDVFFDGVGGSWVLADALVTVGAVQAQNGSLTTGGFAVTSQSFRSGTSSTRTLDMSNTTWTLTGSGTVWAIDFTTGLTLTSTGSEIVLTDTSVTGKTMSLNALTYNKITFSGANAFTVNGAATLTGDLSVGAATSLDTSSLTLAGINLTGFTGTWTGSGGALSLSGDLVLNAAVVLSGITSFTLNGTGPQTLAPHGATIPGDFTIAGTGTVTLASDFALSATNKFILKSGTFDAATYNVSVGIVSLVPVGAGTRVLRLGSGTWTLTRTGTSVTIWDATAATGLTVVPGTSAIVISDATALKLFVGGGLTYYDLTLSATGSGALQIGDGGNTFHTLTVPAGHDVTFPASATTTFTGQCAITGSAGSMKSVRSSSTGVQCTLATTTDQRSMDYLDLRDIAVTGARWFSGRHYANTGDNAGWHFTDWAPRSGLGGLAA
jgi:hypothetical protein